MLLNQYSGSFCITVAGVALPVYRSFKCLQGEEDTAKQWLPYWLIWALFSVCESVLDLVFASWFPLWFEIKLGFVIVRLALPRSHLCPWGTPPFSLCSGRASTCVHV